MRRYELQLRRISWSKLPVVDVTQYSMATSSSNSSGRGEHKSRKGRSKNGFIKKTPVICPEMCCYCFDILIGYIQNKTYTESAMKDFFPNDE